MGEEQIAELTEQMQRAFDAMVELAVAENVLFVVLAGDVYDNAESQDAQQGRFQRGLERLDAAGIPVYIALGNHDPLREGFRPRKPYPANVTFFRTNDPEEFEVASDGARTVMVSGVSYGERHEKKNLAERFGVFEERPGVIRVGVLHTNVTDGQSAADHDPYAPCTVADLRAAPVHYWALGHIHLRSVNQMGPGRWWAYPGNLQGRNFKPAECHPKGALLVPITETGVGEPEFHPCDTVRFVTVEVDISDSEGIPAVQQAMVDDILAEVGRADGRRVVVRARLIGRTPLHGELRDAVSSGTFMRDVMDTWRDDLGLTLVAGVAVDTRPDIDMSKAREGETLLAVSLRRLDAMTDDEVAEIAPALVGQMYRQSVRVADVARFRSMVESALVDALEDAGTR